MTHFNHPPLLEKYTFSLHSSLTACIYFWTALLPSYISVCRRCRGMTHFNHPPLSGGSLNTGKETRKAYKTRMSGTFRKNTLWINILWNKHLSLKTHFRAFKPSYTPGSLRLITLIKCLKGHKSLRTLCDGPETLTEWKSKNVWRTNQPTNIWLG